jgi:hypothetical protein
MIPKRDIDEAFAAAIAANSDPLIYQVCDTVLRHARERREEFFVFVTVCLCGCMHVCRYACMHVFVYV